MVYGIDINHARTLIAHALHTQQERRGGRRVVENAPKKGGMMSGWGWVFSGTGEQLDSIKKIYAASGVRAKPLPDRHQTATSKLL